MSKHTVFFLLLLMVGLGLLGATGCGSPTGSSGASDARAIIANPGTISPTTNPLVASYALSVTQPAQVTVEFGTTDSYGRSTSTSAAPIGGGPVTLLVAGMRAETTYHMRARVDLDGETVYDSDHTFTTGSLPAVSFPSVKVTPAGHSAGGGVDLVSTFGSTVNAVAYDTDGSLIWYYYDPALPGGSWPNPIRELSNGNYLINTSVYVREIDLTGRVLRQISFNQINSGLKAAGYSFQIVGVHHDVVALNNGHWILLANEYKDFQDLPGYPGTTTVLGDDLIDIDLNNNVAWAWRAFDHLDVNRHPFQFPDWTHCNAIVYTPDGNLLLSSRHQNWILKIDYKDGQGSGDVLWHLGPEGDFALSDPDPAQWFYDQHFPVIEQVKGSSLQLALFDNGDTRPDSSGQACYLNNTCYSRGVEMKLDEDARTAAITWQYSPGWFAYWGGSISHLSNGDWEFDSPVVGTAFSRVIEVTGGTTSSVTWQMDSSHNFFYRAYRIPSLYPGVQW